VRKLTSEFNVDTKADTAIFPGSGRKIAQFAKESLENLQTEKVTDTRQIVRDISYAANTLQVRTYFFHGPDETVPFSEQLEAANKLYQEGRFEKLGLSNFSLEEVLEVHAIAKEKGYIAPSVYQSNYSAAVRTNEESLFPTLRKLGYSIQAYSPMATGLLVKTPADFAAGKGSYNPDAFSGKILRPMFDKPSYMKMLAAFGKLSEESGISRTGLAYRWVRHHSFLKAELGDEMIIGGTTAEQVANSLKELEGGPLEPWVADRISQLWEIIKEDAPRDNLKFVRKAVQDLASS
jgi:aflatoxin B1 aldehyde reductase